jgi:tRNA dimethylallyltransferase
MVALFKRDTRRFAKRQMTWFRRQADANWLMIEESEPLEETVARIMRLIDPYLMALDTDKEQRA